VLQPRPQVVAAVAPDLPAEHGMIAPQHAHGRHVDDGEAARLEQPEHLGDRRLLVGVGQRIQDIEGSDDIKGSTGKRHRRHAGACEPGAARLATDAETDFGQVEAVGAAESVEQNEVGTGSASAVEQARIRPARGRLSEQRRDESAEAAEPEMARFRSCGRAQQMFHPAHCIVFVT